ncbi:hypothetical protein F383_36775 [Gossypium arboreum]|uniref:Uncharacterized protein n=1 Tax=Gossypium arboreum TaxID=29729 RepID=A0A0B0M9R8_GOSAR|nr:hypothetical protein F383_36775 [Gossypium arboreum]
MCYREGFSPNG